MMNTRLELLVKQVAGAGAKYVYFQFGVVSVFDQYPESD